MELLIYKIQVRAQKTKKKEGAGGRNPKDKQTISLGM